MARESSPEFDAWLEEAKAAPILEAAQARPWGSDLKRSGNDYVMACPACGGKDGNEFIITPKKKVFLCRKAGKGGDTLAMILHAEGQKKGKDFLTLIEEITGKPPPDRKQEPTRPVSAAKDRSQARERQEERLDDLLARMESDEADYRQNCRDAQALYARCELFEGSHAAAYLRARKVLLRPSQTKHFRFLPALDYWGYDHDDSDRMTRIGAFPCLIAPFQLPSGEIIGIHRTYLDPESPAKLSMAALKISRKLNRAKKMLGNKRGGLIYMDEPREVLACGEGIETTGSWSGLITDEALTACGIDPNEVWIAAAGDLGNLCGGATGTMPHPVKPNKTVPNGDPRLDASIAQLPSVTTGTILLGDGDSDPIWTRAVLLTGARRRRADGYDTWIHMAPDKTDWNSFSALGEAA